MQSIVAESFKIKVVEAFKYDIVWKKKKTFLGTNVFPNITDASGGRSHGRLKYLLKHYFLYEEGAWEGTWDIHVNVPQASKTSNHAFETQY